MSEYQKQTKDTIDLPAYVLCFLKVIMDKLEFYGFINGSKTKVGAIAPDTMILPIISKEYCYCFDAVSLIEKTINRRGFNCKMEKYKVVDIDDADGSKTKGYSFEYKITKKK